jgi:hypothetical protein
MPVGDCKLAAFVRLENNVKSSMSARKSLELIFASVHTPIQFSNLDIFLHVLGHRKGNRCEVDFHLQVPSLRTCAGSAVDILDSDPSRPSAESADTSAGSAADTQDCNLWLQEMGNVGCTADFLLHLLDLRTRSPEESSLDSN